MGKKRVARLMRQLGIRGADGKRGGPRTTIRDPKRPSAPDLVDRNFARLEPNRLWVCDLKYIQTGQGFLFLAVVQDVFSRRIIGWSMRDDLKAELVLDALGMAVSTRGPAGGVIAHSDHGSQYTSLVYGTYAKQSGIDLSMGSVGDPWDNAVADTFFASLAKELLHRERFQTREQARLRIFWYIECFYNPRRRHSSLGMLSPIEYEQRHQQEAIAAQRIRCQRKRVISTPLDLACSSGPHRPASFRVPRGHGKEPQVPSGSASFGRQPSSGILGFGG